MCPDPLKPVDWEKPNQLSPVHPHASLNRMKTTPNTPHWYDPMRQVQSLGSTSARPGSLAGLHALRQQTLSQFFTSDDLAAFLWRLVEPVMDSAILRDGGKVPVLDNSIGSGRLIQFASPSKHTLSGADVYEPTIELLQHVVESAGFECDLVVADMASLRPQQFAVALINPPFSLSFDSPLLDSFSCNTWGVHGMGTAVQSHAYALHQALEAAQIVAAILPRTYADQIVSSPTPEMHDRIRAVLHVPKGSFRGEGTEVDVSVIVFGLANAGFLPVIQELTALEPISTDLDLFCSTTSTLRPRDLDPIAIEASTASIPGKVTGDNRVRIVHSGRKLHLKFSCALTHAQVINAVMGGEVLKIEGHRYPKGIRFKGQGWLDLQLYLAQPDPMRAFDEFMDLITAAGGAPDPDQGLINHLRRSHWRAQREGTPFGHVIKGGVVATSGAMTAVAKRKRLLEPTKWGSPLLSLGDRLSLTRQETGGYLATLGESTCVLQEEEVARDFELEGQDTASEWRQAHPPRGLKYQALATNIRSSLDATMASHVASWDFQVEDLVETRMSRGSVLAWRMGCGKGRAAIALCLAGGRQNAIVVESHLVAELVDQIKESGLSADQWQVIRRPDQCKSLRKINVVSYGRLRRPIAEGAGRRTYAALLRRRFSTVVADEAHLLRHLSTAQTRALWALSPRRRYGMTGTPIANQVQDILPLAQWAVGDGTVNQPYGRFHPYLEPRLLYSMSAACRGVEKFADDFTVFEWVTRGFQDGLELGAKRQIPKIRSIEKLRDWAAPLIKRRHETEPDVAKYFKVPEPTTRIVEVPWDQEHLSYYLETADEFARFYRDAVDKARTGEKNLNLAIILLRIGAVLRACNYPQHIGKAKFAMRPYLPLTSKQRAVIDRAEVLTNQHHKTVIYTDSPQQCGRMVSELAKRGIAAVRYDGSQTIAQRTKSLNERFRYGPDPVLVASIATVERGLNIWQADRGLFLNRSWSSSIEDQAMRRLLRPQQTRDVEFEFFHLPGSIDHYQNQMVSMKSDSAGAAIDFLTPEMEDQEFVHLDMILNSFVADLANREGLKPFEFRQKAIAYAA